MTSFGERLQKELDARKWSQADLCKRSGLKSGHIAPYLTNKKDRDPRLSTVIKIADALDVSLDYLAGRTDNPMGFCDEELEGLYIDSEARALLRGFELLPPKGKEAIQEQMDFQLSKGAKESTTEKRVDAAAVSGVA